MQIDGGGTAAWEEKPQQEAPMRVELDGKVDAILRLLDDFAFGLGLCLDSDRQAYYKVAQHTVSGDSSKGKGVDQQCTVDIEHDVVAAGKVLTKQDGPKPLALQQDLMKSSAPEQGVMKPLVPKQDLLKPLLLEQDAMKPPLPEQDVLKLLLPEQDVPKPSEQDVMKPPMPGQDMMKPPLPEQEVPKPPPSDQDAMKPPMTEQDMMKPPLLEQDVMKPEPPMPKQDVLKLNVFKDLRPWQLEGRINWIHDVENKDLLTLLEQKDQFTWDEVVVMVLHMIRRREFTEDDPKTDIALPTRFCQRNIAFFDLNKESEIVPRPPISEIPVSDLWRLEDSVNVISIKVAESDVGYPINIYGTVLARDEYDYRCIYLFKRGRDNPQLITSPDDTLTLTGPFRAFAVTGTMYFEVHLKIKCNGGIDKDFNKALEEHNTSRHRCQPMIISLENCLSTVVVVYSPVSCAVEASLEVKVLNGASNFTGKIAAFTTVSDEAIILYDSEVAGTDTNLGIGGSVKLSRHIIAVPLDEGLVLDVSDDHELLEFEVCSDFGDDFEYTCMLGHSELQFKVSWSAVERRRRHKMFENIGQFQVLM